MSCVVFILCRGMLCFLHASVHMNGTCVILYLYTLVRFLIYEFYVCVCVFMT